MNDDNDERPVYQVIVSRAQQGMLQVQADSENDAREQAEDEYRGIDWETVHYQVDHVELTTVTKW